MLTWMDGTWGKAGPLNSVTKLAAIVTKSKSNLEYARWVVATVRDRIISKQSSLQDGWSVDLLTGERDKSHKGIIDLYMYKKDMATYLLGGLLESHPFQSEAKADLRKVFQSHQSYRKLFKPVAETPPRVAETPHNEAVAETPQADLSFMAAWRKSTELLCELVEELVFMSKEDGLLKVAMKARKTPAEFFVAYEAPKEKLEEILKQVTNETAVVSAKAEAPVGADLVGTSSLNPDDTLDVLEAELVASGVAFDDVAKFRAQAERRVRAFVKLVSMANMSEQQVKTAIEDSASGKASSCTLLYDPKLVGESRTAPHIRIPPFSESHALTVVGGFTSCRGTAGYVAPGDQVLIMDATKKGLNSTAIPRVFQDEMSVKVKTNTSTQVLLVYSQANLMARRRATRTIEGLRQVETLNVFTARPLSLPYRKRLHFKDCSHDNWAPVIGTVEFERWETCWTLRFKEKKRLFGDFHVAVGGAGDAEPVDDQPEIQVADIDEEEVVEDKLPGTEQLVVKPGRLNRAVIREDSNIEPVFMHALGSKVYEELLHSFSIQAMVDGTPGPGNCALACIKRRVPYIGLCLSDGHADLLLHQLQYLVFQEMKKEDSPLFEPSLGKMLVETGGKKPVLADKPGRRPLGQADPEQPAKKPRAGVVNIGANPAPGTAAGSDLPPPDSEDSDMGETQQMG